jgi:cell envelope opacity-associated protein A
MKLTEIRSEIVSGVFSNEDLDTISQAVAFARNQLAKKNARVFRSGDLVKFTSNRNGRVYQGTVEKVNIKNIIVRTAVGNYRVPANMLEAV